MRKSLRWRLQIWHALILLLVVAGFGSLLLDQLFRAQYDEIEAELASAAGVLEGVLRGLPDPGRGFSPGEPPDRRPPPRRPPPRRPGNGRPGPPASRDEQGPLPDVPPFGPPPGDERGPPLHEEQIQHALELPFSFRERHAHIDQPPFFIIWRPDGSVLKASGIDPSTIQPSKEGDLRDLGDRPLLVRDAAGYQLWRRGPAGSIIVVGRSIEPERRRLRWLTWQVTLSGAAVFAVGLLGGWWLSASAIRPIAAMSATAASISANNLAQRVDLAQFDAEFGDLARTMNEMLDRLELSFRQQAQFTSDASHELRTPLAVILSHIELSLSQARSGEEYRETLATCQHASQRMRVLVDNLLTLARADAGRLELQPRAVDLLQIACDTTELLAPLAAQHGIKLSVEGHASRSLADPLRLAQVVTNLVTNAILYNRRGGAVILHVAEESAASVLNVADTGIGIAEHDLPHLFDRFYRVDRARSRDSGGSGLGLAIARSIITALGGTLTVTSELGVGSTFTIRLPRA